MSFVKSRGIILLQWLLLATLLSQAYKSTLLSTLVTIRYTKPLNTIDQVVESGLPFYFFNGTALQWAAKTDPRKSVKRLYDRRVVMDYYGNIKEQDLKK